MPDAAGPEPPEELVARLRAAGCVFAEDEARLLAAHTRDPIELDALAARRVAGLPLEQLLGWVEFAGLRLVVEPGVFVPRRRTELLAREALALARAVGRRAGRPPVMVELCCGAGAVAAVALADPDPVELYAADIDPVAVHCARRNLGARAAVFEGDLFTALPTALRGRVEVLVANAPYVPTGALALMPPEARLHESAVALDGGLDGLDVLRQILSGAPGWLAPGGSVLVESGAAQARGVEQACARHGLRARTVRSESLDATVVIGSV